MKVEAYKVDCCGSIVIEKDVVGINPIEDLFDKLESYPFVSNPNKVTVHICMHCFSDKVLQVAEKQVNRKKDEEAYKKKLKELSYAFRDSVVKSFVSRKINRKR